MSNDLEQILRKSLAEADNYRRRSVVVSCILAAAVVGGLGVLDHLMRKADVKQMLLFAVATVLVSQVTVAVVTWGVIATAARRVLKAIELLSKD